MLHIHFSNRYEVLADQLLERLGVGERGVFAADPLIVPSTAVRRSLTLRIAEAHGICANVAFSYLAPWLWRQTGLLLPGLAAESPFQPAVLTWRILAVLDDAGFVVPHPRLAAWLDGADAAMRHDFAGRVAALFDQYITYRPDWLDAWSAGRGAVPGSRTDADAAADERWQADLWRRLVGAASTSPSTSAPTSASGSALVEALKAVGAPRARAVGLQGPVHVFALPTLPALHIAWLQQIGRLLEVHLYVLNPCQEYWFELIDRRRLSHLAVRGQADAHQEEGNRLLAAWGRQTQAHVDALIDSVGEASTDDSRFQRHPGATLLAHLQNAILELTDLAPGSLSIAADDRSVEVHVCHSLTRELEVLQDHLLGLLATGAIRHASEVLVVTPDLGAAAASIEAVFGTAPRERQIPFFISGRARSTVNASARALLGLLALVSSRFQASAVFDALQQDVVARRFGLDEVALQQIRGWLAASGTRWGLDGAHRAAFGVPAETAHTWADGLDRLFLGYALPSRVAQPFADLLPAGDAEGSEALALGALWQFVDRLRALHTAVALPRPPEEWRGLLLGAVADFLAPAADEHGDQRELVAAIDTLVDTMLRGGLGDPGAPALPLAVVRAALLEQLDDPAHGGVPTGGVTFSSMGSLRSLPFNAVCVIGLNDGAFPSAQRPPEFDLMPLQPRRGDRQRRTDERNLFLDLLLAARRSLYLSHTGRRVRDNALLPPSVLIAELLDLLVPAIAEEPASPESRARARRRLVVEHPLQSFAVAAFDVGTTEPRLRSHDRELGEALRRSLQAAPTAVVIDEVPFDEEAEAAAVPEALPAFFTRPLAAPGPEWRPVTVEQLVSFFRNPSRFLLRQRLGIELGRAEDALADDEPFLPDRPGRTALAARLLEPLQAGAAPDVLRQLARAGVDWPVGTLGLHQLDRELAALTRFAESLQQHTAGACLPPHAVRLDLALDGEDWQLAGSFADLRASGLVRWRYDEARAGDVLAAWIPHLVLCAAPAPGAAAETVWLSLDPPLRLGPPPEPTALLQDLLRLYRHGLAEPLAFFPKAAWSHANGASLMSVAREWHPSADRPYAEGADAACRLAWRGRGDALGQEFSANAHRVFAPVLAALQGGG